MLNMRIGLLDFANAGFALFQRYSDVLMSSFDRTLCKCSDARGLSKAESGRGAWSREDGAGEG